MSASSYKSFILRNPWYELYRKAKARCEDPKHRSYRYYGAVGIKFLMSMHEVEGLFRWCGGHWMKTPSLDRKDATKDYTLDNCRIIEKAVNERLPHNATLRQEWTD